ncbi:MAG TPA: hypothetical protein VIM21_07550 [Gemmatimonadaceae bacterium]
MTGRASNRADGEKFARTTTSLGLWFGVLGGPAAGFANVLVGYPAVDRACASNSSILLHVLTLTFLAIAVLAGIIAWSLRQRAGDWPASAGGLLPRSRFMATVGVLTAAVSAFGIILQWIPMFFIGACHGT